METTEKSKGIIYPKLGIVKEVTWARIWVGGDTGDNKAF